MSFSKKMEELEMIVASIENGPMPLEESLALFEKGIGLVRECRSYLAEAKVKINILSKECEVVPFTPDGDQEGEEE